MPARSRQRDRLDLLRLQRHDRHLPPYHPTSYAVHIDHEALEENRLDASVQRRDSRDRLRNRSLRDHLHGKALQPMSASRRSHGSLRELLVARNTTSNPASMHGRRPGEHLRCVCVPLTRSTQNPIEGAQNAGSWAVRETFVATVTTNLPIVYPLFHKLLTMVLDTLPGTKRSTRPYSDKPRDFMTIGGSGGLKRNPTISYPISKGTFSESEERIMGVVHLQDVGKKGSSDSMAARKDDQGIQKQVEVTVARRDHDGSDEATIIGDRRYLD